MAVTTQARKSSIGHSITWWWFLVSSLVVIWDIGFVCLRPRSMPGGDLHWIWKPYEKYVLIDKIYGFEALENKNGFTMAQTMMNVVESALNLAYVAMGPEYPTAPLVGWTGASLTLAKTILYWLQEYYCEYCSVGHNTLSDAIFLWMIPNGIWIIIPAYICVVLGRDLVQSLRLADAAAKGKAKAQ